MLKEAPDCGGPMSSEADDELRRELDIMKVEKPRGFKLSKRFCFSLFQWRLILLISMSPSVGLLFLWPYLPESVRWQIGKGKMPEAQKEVDR